MTSWTVMATSWAPPRLLPDMWVIWGRRGLVGRLWLVFPRHDYSPGVSVHRALAFPLERTSPPPPPTPIHVNHRPQVWPSPALPLRHPCFSAATSSPLGSIPISYPSPLGPAFSDLLIGKGRGGPPACPGAFFPFPRT